MNKVESFNEKCAICLGNFDGLHLAHMDIIDAACRYSKEKGIKSGVLLFDRHTSEVFGGDTKLLTTQEEKFHILEKSGVDFLYVMHFDKAVASKDGEEFIRDLLEKFSVDSFFVGYDYAFGKGAGYKVDDLKKLGEKFGFSVNVKACKNIDDEPVSSTRIRDLVLKGEVEKVPGILGREYFILSRIEKGFGNGKKHLVPTANLTISENKLLPADGVYKAVATILGERYKAAVNVGKNPTFDAGKRTVEAHILDFSGDLYDKEIKLEFLEKIRDDIKFESVEDLKKQIENDIKKVQEIKL